MVLLKEARQLAELTQQQLASKARISISYLQVLEAGGSMPTLSIAWRLALALNTVPEALWTDVDKAQAEGAA
jgi:transcriptional regulator with XRE-family HTH domain